MKKYLLYLLPVFLFICVGIGPNYINTENLFTPGGVVDDILVFDGTSWWEPVRNASSEGRIKRSEWLQNGFVTKSDVGMTWDDATMTFTVGPTSSTFDYYHDGIKYVGSSSDSIAITDTVGLWGIYYDGTTLSKILNPTHSQIDSIIENETTVAYVYWDAVNNDGRLFGERHGYRMSPATHHLEHDTEGAAYDEGMALGDILADENGSLNSHAQFSVTAGEFYDEDLEQELTAVNSTTGLEVWYLSGSDWMWMTNAGFSVLTAGSGRLAWNDSGSQTEVTNNYYVLTHVFATSVKTDSGEDGTYIAIQGQAQYLNAAAAREGAETEITTLVTTGLPLQELLPVATVIYHTKNAYSNDVNAAIVSTGSGDDYVDWRFSTITASGGSIASHNVLSELAIDVSGHTKGSDSKTNVVAGDNILIWDSADSDTAKRHKLNIGLDTSGIDFKNLQARYMGVHSDTIANIDTSPTEGQYFYASDIKVLMKYEDGAWRSKNNFAALDLYGSLSGSGLKHGFNSSNKAEGFLNTYSCATPETLGANVTIQYDGGDYTSEVLALPFKNTSGGLYTITLIGSVSTDLSGAVMDRQYFPHFQGVPLPSFGSGINNTFFQTNNDLAGKDYTLSSSDQWFIEKTSGKSLGEVRVAMRNDADDIWMAGTMSSHPSYNGWSSGTYGSASGSTFDVWKQDTFIADITIPSGQTGLVFKNFDIDGITQSNIISGSGSKSVFKGCAITAAFDLIDVEGEVVVVGCYLDSSYDRNSVTRQNDGRIILSSSYIKTGATQVGFDDIGIRAETGSLITMFMGTIVDCGENTSYGIKASVNSNLNMQFDNPGVPGFSNSFHGCQSWGYYAETGGQGNFGSYGIYYSDNITSGTAEAGTSGNVLVDTGKFADVDITKRDYFVWNTTDGVNSLISSNSDNNTITTADAIWAVSDNFEVREVNGDRADPELVTDGDFTSASGADWTFETGWTHNATDDSAEANLALDKSVYQDVVVPVSTKHLLTFRLFDYISESVVPLVGGSSGTTRSANGTYTEIITTPASVTDSTVRFTGINGAGFRGEITDVSLRPAIDPVTSCFADTTTSAGISDCN